MQAKGWRWTMLGLAWVAQAVMAAPAARDTGDQARLEQELASCEHLPAYQAPENCRREVRSAYAQARRSGLGDTLSAEQYLANALQRCTVHHQADDRSACEARMRGQGRVHGSVGQGGLLRELELPTKAP